MEILLVSSEGSKLSITEIEKEPRQTIVYNFEVKDFNSYFVSDLGVWVHSRNGALNQAKRDAGIPRSQHPESLNKVDMRSAQHEGGHVIKDSNGKVISTREYAYTNKDSKKIVIQDHSAGHQKGGQGPHINVRRPENTRTCKVLGTQKHYPFKK